MVADSGKKIPLIPGTKNPHVCPTETQAPPTPPTPPKEENQATLPDTPVPRDFDEEKCKAEVKLISKWARDTARAHNPSYPNETDMAMKGRQIDINVDKKDLMRYFFEVKYGQKKNSVDKIP